VLDGMDASYEGPGHSIRIHGNGYLFPWEPSTLRERVTSTPKMQRLRRAVEDRFGGQFVFPAAAETALRNRWVDGDRGWVWFISESM
jgi:hypothetical protein